MRRNTNLYIAHTLRTRALSRCDFLSALWPYISVFFSAFASRSTRILLVNHYDTIVAGLQLLTPPAAAAECLRCRFAQSLSSASPCMSGTGSLAAARICYLIRHFGMRSISKCHRPQKPTFHKDDTKNNRLRNKRKASQPPHQRFCDALSYLSVSNFPSEISICLLQAPATPGS